jgi:undecaprenyl diphosphate synthase
MPETPKCIGIILDGNRRWAASKGISKFEGHQHGADNLERVALAVRDRGIKHLVVYAFSTENWSRTAEEVAKLLDIFGRGVEKYLPRLATERIQVCFVGERERFSPALQEAMARAEANNPKDYDMTFWICVSYGSRAEITHAAQEAAREGKITEESITKHLWTAGMPDPDLIIRPGGEKRLSNFLLWQGAYSELFFVDAMWPDFSKEILDRVLTEYNLRQRRMGR